MNGRFVWMSLPSLSIISLLNERKHIVFHWSRWHFYRVCEMLFTKCQRKSRNLNHYYKKKNRMIDAAFPPNIWNSVTIHPIWKIINLGRTMSVNVIATCIGNKTVFRVIGQIAVPDCNTSKQYFTAGVTSALGIYYLWY